MVLLIVLALFLLVIEEDGKQETLWRKGGSNFTWRFYIEKDAYEIILGHKAVEEVTRVSRRCYLVKFCPLYDISKARREIDLVCRGKRKVESWTPYQ